MWMLYYDDIIMNTKNDSPFYDDLQYLDYTTLTIQKGKSMSIPLPHEIGFLSHQE